MRLAVFCLGALLVSAPARAAETCAFEGEAREWATKAFEAWGRIERERLRLTSQAKPVVHLIGERCHFVLTPRRTGEYRVAGRSFQVKGLAHGGMIDTGVTAPFPVGKTAFASGAEDGKPLTFAIALPEVWGADKKDRRDPERLFMAVFMHEFSHVQQAGALEEALSRAYISETGAADDAIQAAYAEDPDYVRAYNEEREAFLAAASAPTREEARRHLAEAADLMAARRTRWFADKPDWVAADDVFLTMEGSGQWAAYVWSADPRGGAADPAQTFSGMRTRWWSQEEGLAIALALDRVTPDWPALTFNTPGLTFDALIRRALESGSAPAER